MEQEVAGAQSVLDGDLNDTINAASEETNPAAESASSSSIKSLVENDIGEIGYWNKSGVFTPMTNFAVKCVGYVVDSLKSTSANGFLFQVIPKGGDIVSEEQLDDAGYVKPL